ncbi:hypothetical protein EOL70_03680 [Leucothrix sargassi]|nr:hypothetical protein EOL70_03680 [Leucothrix sargassi]
MKTLISTLSAVAIFSFSGSVLAASHAMPQTEAQKMEMAAELVMKAGTEHAMKPAVMASDQSVASGVVTAKEVHAGENGWLVVHRTTSEMKPGPVIGYAPLRKGKNTDVVAILTEMVKPSEKLMLMVHSEKGGMKTGRFEYTLGAKEDGPIKPNGKLVMKVITAK